MWMDAPTRAQSVLADERGLIFSWLAKLALGFVVVAVVIFDGGAILVNFFTLDSTADEIAISITTNVGQRLDERTVLERARPLADEAGARIVDVTLDPTERRVTITLRRRADTLLVGRISWIKHWARATAEGQSGTT